MRTIKNLLKNNGRVYVYLANTEIGHRFLQQAEAEGFTYGDGAKPMEREYAEIMAINSIYITKFMDIYGRWMLWS